MTPRIKLVETSDNKASFEISSPFDIGPRLAPSLLLSDGSRVSIYPLPSRDEEGRVVYQWWVDSAPAKVTMAREVLAEGKDIRSGVGSPVDLEQAFDTFAAFLESWVDRCEPGSSDLFPMELLEWADINHDELYLALTEPEGVDA